MLLTTKSGGMWREAFRDRRGGDTGHRHAMRHDMVWVSVAAVGIVGDHHLRTVLPDQGHQATGHVLGLRTSGLRIFFRDLSQLAYVV